MNNGALRWLKLRGRPPDRRVCVDKAHEEFRARYARTRARAASLQLDIRNPPVSFHAGCRAEELAPTAIGEMLTTSPSFKTHGVEKRRAPKINEMQLTNSGQKMFSATVGTIRISALQSVHLANVALFANNKTQARRRAPREKYRGIRFTKHGNARGDGAVSIRSSELGARESFGQSSTAPRPIWPSVRRPHALRPPSAPRFRVAESLPSMNRRR
jgi:hypothetical protein